MTNSTTLQDKICAVLLFFIALNFGRLELYLWVVLIGYMLLKTKGKLIGIKVNSFIPLLLFFVVYTMMLLIKGHSLFTSVLTYLVCPIGAYCLGCWFVRMDNIKKISIFLISVSIGRGLHGLLNMLPYIFEGYTSRNPIDFWSKGVIAATGAGTLFVLAVSLIYYAVFTLRNNKFKGIFLLIFCTLCIISAIYIGTRGCLLIAAITCGVCVLCFTNLKNKDARRTIFSLILIFAFVCVAYILNLFNLRTIFENSGLYRRLYVYNVSSLEDNERWKFQAYMLQHLFDYPFGVDNMMFSHNLWLDVARLTGIIPFFFSIIMSVELIKTAYIGIKSELISKELRILFLSLLIAIFIVFFIEPVLEGCPSIFILFIMICAMCGKIKQLELSESIRK